MKRRRERQRKGLTIFILALPLIFTLISAQEPPPPPPHKPPPEMGKEFEPPEGETPIEAIESIRMWRLSEELKLSEEQAAKLFPKFRSLRELKREADKMRVTKIGELAELLLKKAKPEELKKMIRELRELEKKYRDKEEGIWKEIESILSTEQFARFLIFQHRFEGEIKRMLRNMKDIRRKR